jgi:phosphopantetheinyl transferase
LSALASSPAWVARGELPSGGVLCLGGIGVEAAGQWVDAAAPSVRGALEDMAPEVALGPQATGKRRREWLAGRLAASAALGALSPSARVAVRASGPRSGQPYGQGAEREWGLSISHAGAWAMAAACRSGVGIDLEPIVPRSPEFIGMAFTAEERERLEAVARALGLSPTGALTLCWSAKEAALKLLGVGLRAPLLAVEVLFSGEPSGLLVLQGAERVERLHPVSVLLRCSEELSSELGVAPVRALTLGVGLEHDHLYTVIWE